MHFSVLTIKSSWTPNKYPWMFYFQWKPWQLLTYAKNVFLFIFAKSLRNCWWFSEHFFFRTVVYPGCLSNIGFLMLTHSNSWPKTLTQASSAGRTLCLTSSDVTQVLMTSHWWYWRHTGDVFYRLPTSSAPSGRFKIAALPSSKFKHVFTHPGFNTARNQTKFYRKIPKVR